MTSSCALTQNLSLLLILFFGVSGAPFPDEIDLPEINWTTCQSTHLSNYLHAVAKNYSQITRLISIGKSIEGKDLWVLIISDSPETRPLLRPQIKFVGNFNGFSGPACYVLLRLINHLLMAYQHENSLERKLIQMNEIHILPNMNPDGFRKSIPGECETGQGRHNSMGKDLNRDFPDIFNPMDDHMCQPETKAIMKWIATNNFVLSMSIMSGALVVSYPFDAVPFSQDIEYQRHGVFFPHFPPDHDIFKHLTTTFVHNVNVTMNGGVTPSSTWHCPALQRTFPGGIVNGAEWMPVSGTMLDYNYVQGTIELLVGISCCRNENNEETLNQIWLNNKMAMVKMIQETEYGVRGQVVDADTWAPLQGAEMSRIYQNFRDNVGINPMPWHASPKGEFWRPLIPGKYIIEVQVPGYKNTTVPFEVKPTQFTLLFIQLDKAEPTTTTILPEFEDYYMFNNITQLNSIVEEDGNEMRDQSHNHFEELFGSVHESQFGSGMSTQETSNQNDMNISETTVKPMTQRSWIQKLFGNKGNRIEVMSDKVVMFHLIIIAVFLTMV